MTAIGAEVPRLSWRLSSAEASDRQVGYEIEVAATPEFESLFATSGDVPSSSQIAVPAPGGSLASREVRFYRVRVRTPHGWSAWSSPLRVEAGLLEPADWEAAQAITLPDDPGRERTAPVPILRREFDLEAVPLRARLYVTSLGLHDVRINGHRVGDQLLSPGWTSFGRRLLADTHDVTALLRPGRNAIGAMLGDGWYRGRIGFVPGEGRRRYGDDLGLLLLLEAELPDGRRVTVASDESWRGSTSDVRAADLYDGACIDQRDAQPNWDRSGFDDARWPHAAVVSIDRTVIEPRMAPPVRAIEVRRAGLGAGPDDRILIDTGQNLAGFLRLRVRGRPGDRVTVRHAEVLEPDGSLHTRALRSARATDDFILADDAETVLEPVFTFHGFRHAEVATRARVLDVEVAAISSDLPVRSSFACSDERLNQLHRNVVWSQRGNFVSIPTDCPQRDERLGWTGDAQAFAATACTLLDAEAFWQSWLRDLELEQDDDLGVPSVVPDVVLEGEARYGRAGWADAATIVPWAVYESFGDPEVLRRQFGSMRRWVDSLVRRRGPDGLLVQSWQFGDWLDPDAPPDRPWEAKADADYIANSFFSWSARLVADAAALLGDGSAGTYAGLAEEVAAVTWSRWSADAVRTQTGCAIALRLRIAPEDARSNVADALASLVDAADGRVATGFLGTPLVLPALAEAGRFDQAYRMLLRTESPSWLYQVQRGATTVWERWDAIRPDGSIHPGTMAPLPGDDDGEEGHMLSFNHYAYGAVIDWVYRHLAGLAPDRERPGYVHTVFAPRPVASIQWSKASVEARLGTVAIEWRIDDGLFVADVELPIGSTATFIPPATSGSVVTLDDVRVTSGEVSIRPGRHRVTVSAPAIALSGRA